jgi:hypothetical protein
MPGWKRLLKSVGKEAIARANASVLYYERTYGYTNEANFGIG